MRPAWRLLIAVVLSIATTTVATIVAGGDLPAPWPIVIGFLIGIGVENTLGK